MSALTVSETLRAAADLIEPKGAWTQGDYVGPNGNCWCVLGAIQYAGDFYNDENPANYALRDHLGIEEIPEWNDAPERTQAEVVAALRAAAVVSEGL